MWVDDGEVIDTEDGHVQRGVVLAQVGACRVAQRGEPAQGELAPPGEAVVDAFLHAALADGVGVRVADEEPDLHPCGDRLADLGHEAGDGVEQERPAVDQHVEVLTGCGEVLPPQPDRDLGPGFPHSHRVAVLGPRRRDGETLRPQHFRFATQRSGQRVGGRLARGALPFHQPADLLQADPGLSSQGSPR